MSNWYDWMTSVFSPAAEPPPPVALTTPAGGGEPPPMPPSPPPMPPSPVLGCDADSWATFETLLKQREGCVLHVYQDSLGKDTAGIGHLMVQNDGPYQVGMPVTPGQVDAWFTHDGADAMTAAVAQAKEAGITTQAFLPFLASVCFQLGLHWTAKFPNTWSLIVRGQYETAANAVMATLWAGQTPVRARDFAAALRALPPKVGG